jgi:hypothetical protein
MIENNLEHQVMYKGSVFELGHNLNCLIKKGRPVSLYKKNNYSNDI